jgi:hypothetical protein
MPLTRESLVDWLVDENCRSHLDRCNYPVDPASALFTRVIGDGLRRINRDPADPSTVTDDEIAAVPGASLTRLYLACLIALKRRVLQHYLSQVTSEVLQTRKEYDKRSKDLMADIQNDELLLAEEISRATSSGIFGGRTTDGTNVPDAIRIPYHP